ncbi:NAD(P)/FAD-dependent oxidoreductase [Pseudonocardia sp. N23]|uniref:NAD(P)/FAD-dependent oxidoreductase n=1 Tax=Pseudonocardia sp. N23 TaxID=1987376 RepID=UPI000BFDC038|nr:NAD(P)/FAD-dependent oxidoreductase [Pseudonocardia sp. N23]GAY08012.1 ferredoxin reductase [Pseudonocardia sp. N23]
MPDADLLVIGTGPAAVAAARAYRENDGAGAVVMVTDDDAAPYERPPLSKEYLRGETAEGEFPLELSAGVDLRTGRTVTGLDTASVTLDGHERLTFGSCVLATGAEPVTLPVPGADHPDVAYLRTLATARTLRERAGKAGTAVVVGSGFIGCEVAASLVSTGVSVTVVSAEEAPQQDRLGAEVAGRIAGWLRELGIELVTGAQVESIDGGRRVRIPGRTLDADLVLVAGGARPRTGPAGWLDTHDGRIVVDDHMRTGAEGILAAGDVAYALNASAGRHLAVEHWGDAESMGTVAGITAAGGDAVWDGPPGFWTVVGRHTLKYAAWGDGHDEIDVVDHGDGAFTAWYGRNGVVVGVAAHGADDDYERGGDLVRTGAPSGSHR